MLDDIKKTNPFIYKLIRETLIGGLQKDKMRDSRFRKDNEESKEYQDVTISLEYNKGSTKTYCSISDFIEYINIFFSDKHCKKLTFERD